MSELSDEEVEAKMEEIREATEKGELEEYIKNLRKSMTFGQKLGDALSSFVAVTLLVCFYLILGGLAFAALKGIYVLILSIG